MPTGPSDTFIAHKAISLSGDLSGAEKRVAATIIDHFNRKTGQCDPALDSIAGLLGLNRRTIIRAITALVKKGYISKIRHGGKFHRNSYLPVWSRFRAKENSWNERRASRRRSIGMAPVSPSQGLARHLAGDAGVTQTCPINLLKETSDAKRWEIRPPPKHGGSTVQKMLSREESVRASQTQVVERFHVKSASPCVAANDAAERRWADQLTRQFASTPEVFAVLIDAIDDDLRNATTQVEFRKPGSGIAFLLAELDKRLPLHPHRGSSET